MADALVICNPHMALQRLETPESPSKRVRMRVWRHITDVNDCAHLPPPAEPIGRHRSKSLESFGDEDGGGALADVKRINQQKALTPSPSTHRKNRKLSFDNSGFHLLHTSPELIAGEITNIDLPLFQAIPRHEFLEGKWTSKQKAHVSPCIVAFTLQFNQISFWVMKEIIGKIQLKARAECLAYFIRVAKKLLELNNINSVVAIISALQSAPIFRLKKTWAEVPKKEKLSYQRLQSLLSEDDNRKNLRNHMDLMKTPCIPYLGIFLTDLTYLVAAREKAGKGSETDFTGKMMEIIDRIARWQMSVYSNLEELKPVRDYLESVQYLHEFTKLMEDELFKASQRIEPEATLTSPMSTNSCPPSPTATRRLTLPSSSSVHTSISNLRLHRKSVTVMPSCRGQSVPASLGATESSPSDKRKSAGTPPPVLSNPAQRNLGHRRAHSYDHKLLVLRHGVEGLSVMDTEAKPGPRHLIDDSLMPGSLSLSAGVGASSASVGDISCGKLSPVVPSVALEPVVGIDVHQPDTDSGAESENLLEGVDLSGDEEGSPIELTIDLLDASMTGMLKRRTCRKKGSALPRVQRWKNDFVAVCGTLLAFYAKAPKKRRGRAVPYQVISLADCLVSGNVTCGKPRKFQLLHRPTGKVYAFKAPSVDEAFEWLTHLQSIIEPLLTEKVPPLLMTFDEDGVAMSNSNSSADC